MKFYTRFIFSCITFLLIACIVNADSNEELNTLLMKCTYKVQQEKKFGTAFLIGKPIPGDDKGGYYVLITAAHVFEGMPGDQATIFLREQNGESYTKIPFDFAIRKNEKPLWVRNPKADIAAIFMSIPTSPPLLPLSFLITDEDLKRFEIHPGDSLSCLGYPHGLESNDSGFPILRSGQIASFPILPSNKVRSFKLNMAVFEGNSGGPVYFVFSNRIYGGAMQGGETIQFIMGLISDKWDWTNGRNINTSLQIADVIQASQIRDTIEMLPSKPE